MSKLDIARNDNEREMLENFLLEEKVKIKRKRLAIMAIDAGREDYFTSPFEQKDIGWDGYQVSAFEDLINEYPDSTRYYTMHANAPTVTIQ